jgi:hypothetical protein
MLVRACSWMSEIPFPDDIAQNTYQFTHPLTSE